MPSNGFLPLDQYRLQLYNFALVEQIRQQQQQSSSINNIHNHNHEQISSGSNISDLLVSAPSTPSSAVTNISISVPGSSALNRVPLISSPTPYNQRLALQMSLLHNHLFHHDDPKPQYSYIGLIAMAILSVPEQKLVLSDIYQYILDNYPYFRSRGPGWRNSIRHNLSLNDCFIKTGRSANGKGHYWSIHPANVNDFRKGDFRRRKAQRKVRRHMGLIVDDDGIDSPSPPPLSPPPHILPAALSSVIVTPSITSSGIGTNSGNIFYPFVYCYPPNGNVLYQSPTAPAFQMSQQISTICIPEQLRKSSNQQTAVKSSRKRQFDVASLLAPDNILCSNSNDSTNLQNFCDEI